MKRASSTEYGHGLNQVSLVLLQEDVVAAYLDSFTLDDYWSFQGSYEAFLALVDDKSAL